MTRTNRQKRIRAEARRLAETTNRPGCPTPAKRAYETEEAIHKALRSSKHIGKPVTIYQCACDALHLTKRKARK
jgi:hypothetical protein